jgi:hypothetical protein
MNNLLLYTYLILIGLIILKQINLLERFLLFKENFQALNSESHMINSSLDHFKAPEPPGYLEIDKLPECTYSLKFFYGKNKNYIWNNGKFINMEVLRQDTRNYLIFQDEKYKLRDIRLQIASIIANGKPSHFQLNLVHSNTTATCDLEIIIPIIISREDNVKELEFLTEEQVPQFLGGGREFSNVIEVNMKDIGSLLEKQKFYKYDLLKNYNWLITKPMNININLGLRIDEALKSMFEQKILDKADESLLKVEADFY